MLHDTGVQPFQEGQKLEAHSGAQKARVPVRRIAAIWNPVTSDMGLHVGAAGVEDGPDPVAVDGRKDAKSARTCSPEHPHEHRLGSVVGVMSRRYPGRRGASGRRPKRVPPCGAGPCLEIAARGYPDPGALERHVEGPREALGGVQLSRSLCPEAVVDPVGEEAERQLAAQEGEDVEKGHRVGSAADGDDDGRPSSDEPVLAHGGSREGDERGRMRARQASPELEDLAKLDLDPEERVTPGGGGIVHRASAGVSVEVRAILARETKLVSRHLEAKSVVDEGLQRPRRSRATFMGVAAPRRRLPRRGWFEGTSRRP